MSNVPTPAQVTRWRTAVIVLLAIIAGAVIWQALPESCGHWHRRYQDALTHAIYGTWDDRAAVVRVESDRPAGC